MSEKGTFDEEFARIVSEINLEVPKTQKFYKGKAARLADPFVRMGFFQTLIFVFSLAITVTCLVVAVNTNFTPVGLSGFFVGLFGSVRFINFKTKQAKMRGSRRENAATV